MTTVTDKMLERIDRALSRIEEAAQGGQALQMESQQVEMQELLDSVQAETTRRRTLQGEISDRLDKAIERVQNTLADAGAANG